MKANARLTRHELQTRAIQSHHGLAPVGAALELSADEVRQLTDASANLQIQGERYPESAQRMIDR